MAAGEVMADTRETLATFKKIRQLVFKGSSVEEACQIEKMPTWVYYRLRKKHAGNGAGTLPQETVTDSVKPEVIGPPDASVTALRVENERLKNLIVKLVLEKEDA
jgi:hypothetical protein